MRLSSKSNVKTNTNAIPKFAFILLVTTTLSVREEDIPIWFIVYEEYCALGVVFPRAVLYEV